MTSVSFPFFLHTNLASRQRKINVGALDFAASRSTPTTSAGLGIRWRRASRPFVGCTALTSLETSISTPRVLTQPAWTLAVIAQSISVSLWLPRLTTILPSSVCGHLHERPVTVSTGPFLGFSRFVDRRRTTSNDSTAHSSQATNKKQSSRLIVTVHRLQLSLWICIASFS